MAEVTLIATVFNEAKTMHRFIQSVRQQTRIPDEVVVVDGGSTDGTPDIVRREAGDKLNLKLLVKPGCNISQGRNLAIREASHSLIAASDGGCVLRPDWLEKIVAPLQQDSSIDIVSGFCVLDCETLLQRCVGLATMPGQLEPPPEEQKFFPSGRSVAFRKSVWEAAGGYPEWLYTAEDTFFDIKVKQMGFRFHFARDALVEWAPRKSLRSIWRQFFLYARGGGHLGRGWQGLLWQFKRVVAAAVVIAGGYIFWPVFFLLLVIPLYDHFAYIHPLATRVKQRCGQPRAYWVTTIVLWLIQFAQGAGFVWGTIQRYWHYRRYVRSQRLYMATPGKKEVTRMPGGCCRWP
jgi:glycosyltransferase involved in cell wall biosynthesis